MKRVDNDIEPAPGPAADAAGLDVRRWLKLAGLFALGTVGSLTLAIGAASYPLSGLLVRPKLKRLAQLKSKHLRNLIRRLGFEFEDILISSFDGTKLHGWWMEADKAGPTVVVLHGVKKNRTDVLRAALILRQAGFNVLIFDGRGHGSSEGRYITYGFYERRDVESAIGWLISEKQVNEKLIGIAGESMGAAIALQVAAHDSRVRAVWADSPFASLRRVTEEFVRRVTRLPGPVLSPVLWTTLQVASYRGKFDVNMVEPIALAAQIKCPVFLVHGTADDLISTSHSESIYAALCGKKELWIVEGAGHARIKRHSKREYSERLVAFFKENLKPEE
ncbi:MAG TPA: alpha/beta fold hydrolase [Blastocatellia bacterium]|nr:alpha/beta fold hydrolase [Blastocatellia bacterium]